MAGFTNSIFPFTSSRIIISETVSTIDILSELIESLGAYDVNILGDE